MTLWEATTPAVKAWPRLQGKQDADIVIIGAGVAGLSLALHLADRGLRPVLLEAEAAGAAAAGRSAGVVAPQLVRHTPASVVTALGANAGETLLRLVADGGRCLFETIGDRAQACGATQAGFVAPARGAAGAARIKDIAADWRSIRGDLQVLTGEEITRMTGCVGYQAALLDPTGGSVNPLAYCRLLADEAVTAGATLFGDSRAVSVTAAGDRWRVTCAEGDITAKLLVACANAGNRALHPSLARTVLTMPVTQVALSPMSAAERAAILPGGQAMTDMEADVLSIRFDPLGHLITAYPIGRHGHKSPRLTQLVNQRIAASLPDFTPRPLAYAWTGIAALNPNFLPRLFSVAPQFFALQACNGRGLALNSVIGRAIAHWLADGCPADAPLRPETPRPIPAYWLAQYLPLLLMKTALLRQSVRGRLKPAPS